MSQVPSHEGRHEDAIILGNALSEEDDDDDEEEEEESDDDDDLEEEGGLGVLMEEEEVDSGSRSLDVMSHARDDVTVSDKDSYFESQQSLNPAMTQMRSMVEVRF